MKVKTSVTLSEELLHAIDAQAGQRSAFIEVAAWAYLRAREREQRDARDLAIIDANAEQLNAEALDALDYQAGLGATSRAYATKGAMDLPEVEWSYF